MSYAWWGASLVVQLVKNPPALQVGLGRSPGGGHGNPLQYSCLENTHGQRSLAGYSPWGCKESDTTEQLNKHICCILGKFLRAIFTFILFSIVATVDLAAAAKSLQSCLALCDPIDGSPPSFPAPGILQARTLEWVAISFSNAWKWKVKVK